MRRISGVYSRYTPWHGDQPESSKMKEVHPNKASAPNKQNAVDIKGIALNAHKNKKPSHERQSHRRIPKRV